MSDFENIIVEQFCFVKALHSSENKTSIVMLTGEHPSKLLYKGKLAKVIEKCINIDPNKRFSNVRELCKEL